MSMHHHQDNEDRQDEPRPPFLVSRTGLVFLGFIAIGGLLLFTEHRAHLLGAVLWLLPLACAFMHMFMHGGHGSHSKSNERKPS